MAREELFLVYQPIIDFETGEMPAAEALLRWQHPTRGLIPPMEFIALAEETGVIVDIGAWVLETACEQAAQWAEAGHPIRISVNVSARQLDDPGLVATVHHALHRSGLEPDLLSLEITETALMRDAEAAAAILRELSASGVRIAIDDFGTGYSSLAYLQQFPVNALKIDRTFISACDTTTTRSSPPSCSSAAASASSPIAEGVEEESQLERLRELGCDRGQGYLFAPPLEVAALERFMAEHTRTFA